MQVMVSLLCRYWKRLIKYLLFPGGGSSFALLRWMPLIYDRVQVNDKRAEHAGDDKCVVLQRSCCNLLWITPDNQTNDTSTILTSIVFFFQFGRMENGQLWAEKIASWWPKMVRQWEKDRNCDAHNSLTELMSLLYEHTQWEIGHTQNAHHRKCETLKKHE